MPRRNLHVLWLAAVISLACYVKVDRQGRMFVFALNEVEDRYLEKIDRQDLFEGAMEGMMSRLDDYSAFISPNTYQELEQTLNQEFGGVGIQILLDPDTKQLTVANPLVGSPAYEAGVRAGDRILRIDGESTQGLSLEDAAGRMRGKPGEAVTLTVLHPDESEPLDMEVVRAIIQEDAVLGDTRNADGSWNYFLEGYDKLAYLRINTFGEKTAEELGRVLEELDNAGLKGLIIDLRNDPGGLLGAAVEVCNLFVKSGVIVSTRGRDGRVRRAVDAKGTAPFTTLPIAVLVNQYSASASEIVAACLQDHGRAVIVGERTYGKGTVQEIIELEGEQGAIKLTTSSYWRPSGQNIHRTKDANESDAWGVSPSPGYEVKVQDEELADLVRWRLNRDLYRRDAVLEADGTEPQEDGLEKDPQLMRAIQWFRDNYSTQST
ncbi:MAG: S41 family peptidase [Rhodopirellula sp.]|nr:S41 family peptidase [Rhodopirellula sp.]